MLQTQTIEPRTLSILKKMMEITELQSFNLVGGTALALKYGHRTSIDLDLFSVQNFEHQPIIDALQNVFEKSFSDKAKLSKWGIFCFVDDVKVDLVYYPHPIIYPVELRKNIRIYDDRDLIAMKIQAILGRGKKKDFWDLYELLHHYNLSDMINFHKEKYPNQMMLISIPQALVYFADAENSDEPVSFKNQTWIDIKSGIREKVKEFLM
jgi:hypothetical protein